jgi:hypothetical protein
LKRVLIYIITSAFFSTSLLAQEVVIGLSVNSKLVGSNNITTKAASTDTIDLPFFDDFSNSGPLPSSDRWSDNFAFINNTYPVNPITQGVATLDAIGDNGLLYPTASSFRFEADQLTSCPINMVGVPSDNIYLSFFYQPQGLADAPESSDSLSLQFFSPVTGEWHYAWSSVGSALHPFKPVIIKIDNPQYLVKGFRFRFLNYASLSTTLNDPAMVGNADHWHIDYILIDRGRVAGDTLTPDVAFTTPLRAPLKSYESMPWRQFRDWYLSEMDNHVTLNYRNNDIIVRNVTRSFTIYDMYDEVNVYSSIQGATNVSPGATVSFDAPLIYTFNTTNTDSALFRIKGVLKTDLFDKKVNDTITFYQRFSNFYAVDDGSSESGYGINGQGSNNAMAVYRYRSYGIDTISALSICFNDSYQSANQRLFDIVILSDNNGVPGDILYSEDEFMVDPGVDVNGFHTYYLSDPFEVNGYFFIGWRQRSETFLNAGLDINTPSNNRQFYYLGGTWYPSQVNGSLMLRPVMGRKIVTGIEDQLATKEQEIKIWPNPATQYINVSAGFEFELPGYSINVFDISGTRWINQEPSSSIDISQLPKGVYLLEITYHNRRVGYNKFIKIR